MSRRKEKLNYTKYNYNQNLQLLIVWTIFLGLIMLFFHLIYKYFIKKLFNYILNILGLNYSSDNVVNNSHNDHRIINTTSRVFSPVEVNQNGSFVSTDNNGNMIFDDSIFRVSIGFSYSKEAENLNKSKVKESLSKLASLTDLYLFIQVDTDQDEQIILDYMQEYGIFKAGLKKHRVIFCEKLESIPSMARQLQANMHIDTNQENEKKLLNKVPNISILTLDDDGNSIFELVDTIGNIVSK